MARKFTQLLRVVIYRPSDGFVESSEPTWIDLDMVDMYTYTIGGLVVLWSRGTQIGIFDVNVEDLGWNT